MERTRAGAVAIYSTVCMYDGIELTLTYGEKGGDSAKIIFGQDEEMLLEFVDVPSLERLAAMAAEAAVELGKRLEVSRLKEAEWRHTYARDVRRES
jgi:hypothetical protein